MENARLARFRLKIVGYEFIVRHYPGECNFVADCLSRNPTNGTVKADLGDCDEIPCLTVENSTLRPEPILKDREWRPISNAEFREAQGSDPESQRFKRQQLVQVEKDADGLLVRIYPRDRAVQRIIPKPLQERLLTLSQYQKCAGHSGRDRTLRREYFWQGMSKQCADFVAFSRQVVRHVPEIN